MHENHQIYCINLYDSETLIKIHVTFQADLESAQVQFEKADSRAAALAKQVSSLQAQYAELQESVQEETRQKLASQTRQRQAEDEAASLREQLEEEEQSRKQLESKIILLTTQVG